MRIFIRIFFYEMSGKALDLAQIYGRPWAHVQTYGRAWAHVSTLLRKAGTSCLWHLFLPCIPKPIRFLKKAKQKLL